MQTAGQIRTQKRVATIQDISCYGRCSLTVALPVISAAGVEVCPIPTAVLSTHTGGFSEFSFCDLTENIACISDHWHKLGLGFDAIYTGYLASERQIDIVENFISRFRAENTTVITDPAMADNGELYSGFDKGFVRKMSKLCKKSDIIIPNLTETALLLDENFEKTYDMEYIKACLVKLADIGAKNVVITGVCPSEEEIGAALYLSESKRFGFAFTEKTGSDFHGTGDIFASVITAAVTRGISLEGAVRIAVDFVSDCIKSTADDSSLDPRGGVRFELCLKSLIEKLD
ncbi:MAG: pyridoxamine kinase [Oscillospiraceae bacterium]